MRKEYIKRFTSILSSYLNRICTHGASFILNLFWLIVSSDFRIESSFYELIDAPVALLLVVRLAHLPDTNTLLAKFE
jgi:hypothetical protein